MRCRSLPNAVRYHGHMTILIRVLLFVLLFSPSAHAAKVTVPIDIGLGPSALTWTGPLADDQMWHTGLSISAAAIIDKKTLKKHKKKIPKQYRKQVMKMDEVRIGYMLVPDTLVISPRRDHTAIYGVTWSPVSMGVPLSDGPVRLRAGADLLLSYAYIDSDLEALGTTHFLRPGLGLGADLDLPLSESFLISLHWRSGIYIPQRVGGNLMELGVSAGGGTGDAIWHVGQGSVQLHYRFPYSTRI